METFPRYWHVRRAWLQGFPALLILDMKNAGLWQWRPSGADPPDPFGGGDGPMPLDIAMQLHERT